LLLHRTAGRIAIAPTPMDVITLSRPKALKALSDPELLDLKLKDVFVDWENMFTRSVFPTEHMGAARFPNAAITDDRQGEISTTLAGCSVQSSPPI
jgi:hypothetical protein